MKPGVYYGYHTEMVKQGYSPDMLDYYPDYRYYLTVKIFDEPEINKSFLTYEEMFCTAEWTAIENSIPLVLVEG